MSDTNIPQNKFLIIIAGPTAIGKTQLSIQLAKRYRAEIFSADSRQLYREMTIGTAKPSMDELSEVKHHFINEISIHDDYSVGHYEAAMKTRLEKYFENNSIAILSGGTGLYIRALLEGLDEFPEIPLELNYQINETYEKEGIIWLKNQLALMDPEYFAQVDQSNPRRLMRALGVMLVSGKPYSAFLNQKKQKDIAYRPILILLDMPRQTLYDRINQRVISMMDEGLLGEVKILEKFKTLRALQTVGYQELFDYFDGRTSFDDAIALIQQNTRRYAKRQLTWFRKYGNWTIFDPKDETMIIDYIELKMR